MEWVIPDHTDKDQQFNTRSGMGLFVKVLPHEDTHSSFVESDEYSTLQVAAFSGLALKPHDDIQLEPLGATDLKAHSDVHGNCQIPFQRRWTSNEQKITTFSLTEEFIRYVQAVGSQVEASGPPNIIPEGLQTQPLWVQDIWERWVETTPQTGEIPREGPRLETCFSNPRRWSRCRESRLVILSINFHQWERELLAAWPDKADLTLPTQFAVVFPTPDDADRTAQEQLIIEQQSEPFSRTIVATLYDTAVDEGRPHSIALVVGDRFDIRSFVLLMGYNEICPPDNEQNECVMWMGNIAIQHDQTVNVSLGNAFKLLVRRGIRVSLQELLPMSDRRLRNELQSAIGGQVYRRPNINGFPADANANNNPTASQSVPERPQEEYPPDWLNSLQECFDRFAAVENSQEGRVMYVLVWFLNGGTFLRNESPKVVRLDADNNWWRTELIFPWRDRFERGHPIALHFVDPIPASETWQSHSAHVLVSQTLPLDHVPVVVTKTEHTTGGETTTHVALVVHQFSSAQDVANRFDSSTSSQVDFTVSRGRNQFPRDLTVRVGPGDGLCLRIQPGSSAYPSGPPLDMSQGTTLPLTKIQNREAVEENDDNQIDDDLEDALLMQAFRTFRRHSPEGASPQPSNSGNTCAIGFNEENTHEGSAFQFNPTAPEFLPSINALPAWAQAIDEIYHDWDLRAFAWQGESRATHFMTWYLSPGRDRFQCLHGRRMVLFEDFWNWREQFRRVWIDELDPAAEVDIVYVSPPPTQIEAGITGHIILIQHTLDEWSSVLVSVFDQAVNDGHPFHMAHSFPAQLQL